MNGTPSLNGAVISFLHIRLISTNVLHRLNPPPGLLADFPQPISIQVSKFIVLASKSLAQDIKSRLVFDHDRDLTCSMYLLVVSGNVGRSVYACK